MKNTSEQAISLSDSLGLTYASGAELAQKMGSIFSGMSEAN
jgi:hypothetical protein